MNFAQLRALTVLNEERHFVKASKILGVTQPTLSMQIKSLEDELGIVIFDRSKNPLIPTDQGAVLIHQAQKIQGEIGKFYEIIQKGKEEISGHLNLAILPTISPYLVPLFLKKFMTLYPKVTLTISEAQTGDILNKLRTDEIDAAIVSTPVKDNSVIEKVLFYEPFMLFVDSEHPLIQKKIVDEKDIDKENIWLLGEGHCLRYQGLKLCQHIKKKGDSKKDKEARPPITLESGNMETLKNLVLRSHGVTLLPFLATQNIANEHKRQLIPFQDPEPTREVSIIYSRFFYKETIIQKLEEVILSLIPPELKTVKRGPYFVVNP